MADAAGSTQRDSDFKPLNIIIEEQKNSGTITINEWTIKWK